MAIVEREKPDGRDRAARRPDAAQAGARSGRGAGVPIWGTSPDAIDLAEDRQRFGALLAEEGIRQPENGTATSLDEAHGGGAAHRLPGAGAPELRARRTRHGDLLRRVDARRSYMAAGRRGLGRPSGAARPLPRGRHRGRRRPARRRRARGGLPASCSTSRRPASTPATRRRCCRRTACRRRSSTRCATSRAAWRCASASRPDERAVRAATTARSTCSRSTRAPRAPCRSSPRRSACRWSRSPAG